MSAWEIVASWAEDRAKLWRHDATKAANAYLTNPMAEACNAYAIALGKCAAIMDREAKVFLARARQAPGPAPGNASKGDERYELREALP